MPGSLAIAAVQAAPRAIGADLGPFVDDVARHAAVGARLVAYPELHLFGSELHPVEERNDVLRASAIGLDAPIVAELAAAAADAGVWLVPGTVCERGAGGELFNTALVFSPDGRLAATYRKVFPWRPTEPYDPGDRFVVVDVDGVRLGIDVCYDAWFPEVTRHLAWMGSEVVLNLVKTTTPDREQEVVLARANAIVNQVFMISVNCAGPIGRGRSIVVDPEGGILDESADAGETALDLELDVDHVHRTRERGTAGVSRMWDPFRPGDAPIRLPLYDGRIDPATWSPSAVRIPPDREGQP
ncbi:carbon-nitrogen hydrolase family protein [Pseudonocardia sp. TRM90224]|uniref:carbon-nitrogen hydrolase family protein n=1 Tax=Pseudonocardia sp. TRM90224 TaxID=2812678 RepID=UPI001E5CF785|nr:carbon-nitrogen hydrolase family protein [Pseudonocardia sp. TRM90224]